MERSEPFEETKIKTDYLSDAELLLLFKHDPERAWDLFIKRYADFIFTQLHHLGFDYDAAMDRFVYVCEKLSEENFRRLRTIQYVGERGELIPWLRKVIKNFCINWTWSTEGRQRLFKPITRLSKQEQNIFELYFWKGLAPSEIYEKLHLEEQKDLEFIDVLNSLEKIFSVLNHQNLWHLLCNLARKRGSVSLDEMEEETGYEIADEYSPEEILLQKETAESIANAMTMLSKQEQLAVRFHYEERLTVKEIAEIFHLSEREIKNALKTGIKKLRKQIK